MPLESNTNRLIHETSPYLLQHAHNPVNWYPWGEEALQRAKDEDKPILVSIGYAACHWCHVMERESFENPGTAAIMNKNFINIKIDREERPDLDHIYMDAVQAMTGSGGWPLNVFLTPEGKPFYGGTYFPPQRAYNRPSWTETLESVAIAFREKRHEIDAQAENLTSHIRDSNSFGTQPPGTEDYCTLANTDLITDNILKSADKEWGGFGRAPKFPQTFSIQYLLRYNHTRKISQPEKAAAALEQAILSLDKMIEGGIYDQLGGGLARYSTDTEWLAPHFEKMLYDNALFVSTLSEAYQLTGKERYKEVIEETIGFIKSEMLHSSNGFYAALDADSEGVEGKFYVWSRKEIEQLLVQEAGVFCEYYDVSETGNWEHTNILRVKKNLEAFAAEKNLEASALKNKLQAARILLLGERNKRVRPLTDDKIILGWNALMNIACSKAYAATGNEEYRQLAVDNMQFLLGAFRHKDSPAYYHTWKNGQAKFPAFLDDLAYLLQALLQLHEITTDTGWLQTAIELADHITESFSGHETGYFYFTPAGQSDIIVRKKEVYDGAVPSGNAVMAACLWHLGILLGDGRGTNNRAESSRTMVHSLGKAITKYPTSFGCWAAILQEIAAGTNEITITGPGYELVHKELLAEYLPHKIILAAEKPSASWPMLAGKAALSKPSIYLCRNYTCQPPVFSAKDLISLINSTQNG